MASRVASGLLAVAVAAVAAAPAVADQSLEGTGSITYTWQGDPSHGCAAVGVCDVEGALIVEAQGSADLQGLRHQDIINLNDGTATVRVTTGSGPSATECIDSGSSLGGESVFVRRTGGRSIGTIVPALSSGRCAGPLVSELGGITLAVHKSAGAHPSFDLRTTRTFVAGPFVGSFVSTVTLRPAPAQGFGIGGSSSSSGSFFGGTPPRRPPFVEHVRLRYRVAGLPEPLVASFAGESDPFCTVLGSCGVSGDVALSAASFSGTLTLEASRPVSRPRDARQAVADLKHGRLRLFGELSSGVETSETFDRPDGSRCQDSRSNSGTLTVGGFPPGRGTSVTLVEAADGADAVRTHCPGPSYSDVFGSIGGVSLARAPISVAQLLAPQSTMSLSDPGDFSGTGYAGARSGAIGFSLTLEGIQAGTSGVR